MLRVSGTIVHDMQHLSDLWEAIITALFARGEADLLPRPGCPAVRVKQSIETCIVQVQFRIHIDVTEDADCSFAVNTKYSDCPLTSPTCDLCLPAESGAQWPDLCHLAEFPAQSVPRLLSVSVSAGNLLVLHLYLLQRREAAADPLPLAAAAVTWITELNTLR